MEQVVLTSRVLVATLTALVVAWITVTPCRDHDSLESALSSADGTLHFSSPNARGGVSHHPCAICVCHRALAQSLLATRVSIERPCPVSFVPAKWSLLVAGGTRRPSDARAPPLS